MELIISVTTNKVCLIIIGLLMAFGFAAFFWALVKGGCTNYEDDDVPGDTFKEFSERPYIDPY
jgi:nitrogen fixation-related uncharacterized protein